MKVIDNINTLLKDELIESIKKGSKMTIAASCFSMYAYKELKKQLDNIDELRFIFTSPTFVKESAKKEKREFFIPRLDRESGLYGTEFEIKLRNEMTQKAIAKECADWIKAKVKFRSNVSGDSMGGFITVESPADTTAYMPIMGFTTTDIGCDRGNNAYNMVNSLDAPFAQQYISVFNELWNDKSKLEDVTETVIESISTAYNENAPEFIYFMTLYHVSANFLKIFQKMSCLMKQQASSRARYGICFMTFSVMPCSLSSTSLKNTTAVFLRTVLVLVRLSRHLQLSNIMRTVTRLYLYYARKSSLKTGIHTRTIMSIILSPQTD